MNRTNVQVQMVDNSIEKIEGMKKRLNTNNRSEIVKASIDIADFVTKAIKDGHHIYVGDKGKIKSEVVIPSVSGDIDNG